MKDNYELEIQKLVNAHGVDAVTSAVKKLWNKQQTQLSCLKLVSGNK